MKKIIELVLAPEQAHEENFQRTEAAAQLGIEASEIRHIQLLKRSIDARNRDVKFRIQAEIYWNENPPLRENTRRYPDVRNKKHALIIGTGPAGLFAALQLIRDGIKPILLERGKDVRERRRDLAAINKQHVVNPDSNYCFGEGGAGTYSDGKLYTRSSKRGNVAEILQILVDHGAPEDILIDAHPHIGTNKLPRLISNIRQRILDAGGEIHFNTRVVDVVPDGDSIKGVITQNGDTISSDAVILATGHSASDVYQLLHKRNILVEQKDFAMGVRIEHPQELIDSIQYHRKDRGPYLPAASYALVHQTASRGVYSFCMCPGGFIVPAATEPGEIVVNGMSPSKRDSRFANSGIVVSVTAKDLAKYASCGALSGLQFRHEVEQLACKAGGQTQTAPAQRMEDFVKNRLSGSLPETSYQPGIKTAPLHELLPEFIRQDLQEGFKAFGKKMNGYFTNEAVLLGVESRTSSPVRIPRNSETLQHPQIKGLFPCGEGAGYAGGIVSAAMDGMRCAKACHAVFRDSKI